MSSAPNSAQAAPGVHRHDVAAVNDAQQRKLYKKREQIYP